jgi:putative NADH-flavin reductase
VRIFVLGGTGHTGTVFVEQALAAGHELTAFVRSPDKLPSQARLTVVSGDVLDVAALAAAMPGHDAVVSMLGVRSLATHDFSEKSTATITRAAEQSGTRRVVIMSAFGVGDSIDKASIAMKLVLRSAAKPVQDDKEAGELVLRASDLDWTIVYAVVLSNGPATTTYRAIDLAELDHLPGVPRISRADVAAFLLEAAGDPRWTRRRVVVTGPA